MSTKFFKLQEWIKENLLEIFHIKSEDNVADGFTKSSNKFQKFRQILFSQRGSVMDIIGTKVENGTEEKQTDKDGEKDICGDKKGRYNRE